jgi:hypothetical protein
VNVKLRLQIFFWTRLLDILLWIERGGWRKPRQVVRTPLIVLVLEVKTDPKEAALNHDGFSQN